MGRQIVPYQNTEDRIFEATHFLPSGYSRHRREITKELKPGESLSRKVCDDPECYLCKVYVERSQAIVDCFS